MRHQGARNPPAKREQTGQKSWEHHPPPVPSAGEKQYRVRSMRLGGR